MNRITFILIIAALLTVGCQRNLNEIDDPNVIKVEAYVPSSTRATLTEFESGDIMSLYAVEYSGDEVAPLQIGGNFINNEAMTYDGTKWNAARTLYWSSNDCDFYGFYPYQNITSTEEFPFEVATDQSAAETEGSLSGYEASDLMWAKATKVGKDDGTVGLQFKHLLSRLVVVIEKGEDFEGELPENITTHIYNTVTSAICNMTKGNVEKYQYGGTRTITMRRIDTNTFDAIVVPQHIERSTPLIEITMEGIAYLLNYSLSFKPGYQHTITVTVNTSPNQEKIDISINGEIEDWEQ